VDYSLDTLSLDGSSTLSTATPFKSARATWTLDGPNAIDVDLRPADLAAGDWLSGRRRVAVMQGGNAILGAYLTKLARAGKPKQIGYSASGLGLASILPFRIVDPDYVVDDDVFAVAWSLIVQAQAQADGDMGFTLGAVVGSPPTKRRVYCVGDKVSDGLTELAAGKEGGFDWEIDGGGAFNVWIGGRGTDTGRSLVESDTIDWGVEEETSDLLTYATVFGMDGDGPCDQVWRTRSNATLLAAGYGRRQDTADFGGVSDLDELDDAADDALRASAAGRRHLVVTWIEGRGPWAFGDVWVGDRVSAALDPEFGGTQDMRVTDIALSLEPGKHEFVEHTFESFGDG
jgi:hypothetical protein